MDTCRGGDHNLKLEPHIVVDFSFMVVFMWLQSKGKVCCLCVKWLPYNLVCIVTCQGHECVCIMWSSNIVHMFTGGSQTYGVIFRASHPSCLGSSRLWMSVDIHYPSPRYLTQPVSLHLQQCLTGQTRQSGAYPTD